MAVDPNVAPTPVAEAESQSAYLDLYPTDEHEYRKLVTWCDQGRQAADAARRPHEGKWVRAYKAYNAYVQARKKGDWRSRVYLQIPFTIIETVAPRLVAELPKLIATPYGPEDVESAKAMETLLDWSVRNSKLYLEMVKGTKSALKYGTGVFKTFYKIRTATARRAVPVMEEQTVAVPVERVDPDSGLVMRDIEGRPIIETREETIGQIQVGTRFEKYEYVAYDGPAAEAVDLFNFWVAPEAEDVQSARYVIHRVYRSMDYVLQRIQEGVYRFPPGFGPGDLADLTQEPSGMRRNAIDMGAQDNDPTRKDVELLEYWLDDGRVITAMNRKHILRVHQNPYDHGQKPFIRIVDYFQEHEFYGKGEIEVIEQQADLQNALVNQRIDNVRLIMDPILGVNSSMLVDPSQLTTRPGGVIETRGDLPVNEIIQRIEIGDVTSSAFDEATINKQMIDEVSGISDYQRGVPSGGSPDTASAAMLFSEAGTNRFALKVRLFEMMGWSEIGMHYGSLLQQYTTKPRLVRLLGENGQWLFETFDPESLQGRFDYDIESASSVMTESMRKEEAMSLLQIGAQYIAQVDPMVLVRLWERVLDNFKIKDKATYMPQMQPQLPPEQGMEEPPSVEEDPLAGLSEADRNRILSEMPPELAQMGGEEMPA